MKKRNSAYTIYLIIWIALLAISYFVIQYYLDNHWLNLLISANTSSFLIFGLDKMLAQLNSKRVPEKILYLSSFLGGSIGAIIAINFFRHKTRKISFQLMLAVLIIIQLLLVNWYLL